MIDTPLEIFAAGALAGTIVTFVLIAVLSSSTVRDLEARIDRLRRGLEIIAGLGDAPSCRSARNVLTLDAQEADRG